VDVIVRSADFDGMALKVLQYTCHVGVGLTPNFLRTQERPPIFCREDSMHNQMRKGLMHITAYIYVVVNAIRTPFQGDFLVRVVPRAEALGCFLFARRALGTRTRKCPNSRPGTKCLES
jgi:hypothetical protein